MLTVWCVCVGTKYCDEDVYILRDMVSRHLSTPHSFHCLSDRQIPGVSCVMPTQTWPGWWSKLLLFRCAPLGQHLYFDLDVVIVGPIEGLISDAISLPENWARSGHGGCQSSVMAWAGDHSHIADSFDPGQLQPPVAGNHGHYGAKSLWGDQEFITELLGSPGAGGIAPMQGVYSYKYHCRNGRPPSDARVVCFHGEPKPGAVDDQWVIDARCRTR